MINNARTLLLNAPGVSVDYTIPATEYIPPEFAGVALPAEIATVGEVLFHGCTTTAQRNIRVQQYMQLLHAGMYADHLTMDDGRITYLPFSATGLQPAANISQAGIGDVIASLTKIVHAEHPLFNTRVEPYTTYRNLYTQHTLGLYRLTGVLLAFICRTRDVFNGE